MRQTGRPRVGFVHRELVKVRPAGIEQPIGIGSWNRALRRPRRERGSEVGRVFRHGCAQLGERFLELREVSLQVFVQRCRAALVLFRSGLHLLTQRFQPSRVAVRQARPLVGDEVLGFRVGLRELARDRAIQIRRTRLANDTLGPPPRPFGRSSSFPVKFTCFLIFSSDC